MRDLPKDVPARPGKIKLIRVRIPKRCICPTCKTKQLFKLNHKRFRLVRDMSLKEPLLLKVEMTYAKCLNERCKTKVFSLPIQGIQRYQRATARLIRESIAGIIEDNSTCPRISRRLNRIFNTTGSKSSIDRWKHKLADKYNLEEIVSKLNFSGILCIDEYKPKRSQGYDLIDSDARTSRILYLEQAEGLGRGVVKKHFERIAQLGIKPYAIIFDMRTCFAKAAKAVFGKKILIQHDYFHVMKIIHHHLNRALGEYRKQLKEQGIDTIDIWEARWIILKNIEDWDLKGHQVMRAILDRYQGTVIEDILILKQRIREIFLESNSQKEAFLKRDELINEGWHLRSQHFANIREFLSKPYFKYVTTYLDHPEIPRSGNSENVVRTWRQMEKVRYGFKSDKGRLDHLKLYQVSKYLGGRLS